MKDLELQNVPGRYWTIPCKCG